MRKLFIFLFILASAGSVLADQVNIEMYPEKPLYGEIFQVYFRIFTKNTEDPEISFKKMNLKVLGKSNQGVSTRTVYANGKLSVTRELTIVYEMEALKPGIAGLSEIVAQVGNSTLRHPAMTFYVQKLKRQDRSLFLKADVPKTDLFLGEGITVRYYLYSKVPVGNLDIKKYPQLSHFLKRFLKEAERTERVSVGNALYMRTQLYAVKLFPEKVGRIKIDPLKISLSYATNDTNDPFSAFGLSTRNYRKRTLESEEVEVKVRPVPSPIPDHFTGLVGEHDFQLTVGKNKLIVNEPLDFKLSVTGGGALENMETPLIFENQEFEKFETNGDLKIVDANKAIKEFSYTYLAKKNADLPSKELTLSYFDPETKKFVEKKVRFPAIKVAGQINSQSFGDQNVEENKEILTQKRTDLESNYQKDESFFMLEKLDEKSIFWDYYLGKILKIVNLFLLISAFLFYVFRMFQKVMVSHFTRKRHIPKLFKKNKFHLQEFISWISPLMEGKEMTPSELIRSLDLSDESKNYFLTMLENYHQEMYSTDKIQRNFRYRGRHFKELAKYLSSNQNSV